MCEGVRVFVCVLVFVCFLVVCLLFALFAACVGSSFWVCSSVSVFVVFSCVVSCVLMDFRRLINRELQIGIPDQRHGPRSCREMVTSHHRH